MSSVENINDIDDISPLSKKRKINSKNHSKQGKKVFEMDNGKGEASIDESLYSRQLYVLGHEAMKRMAESNILICGLKGLGLEVAKNIILGGVKSVVLRDSELVSIYDLSSQFYFSESDIGKPRGESCRDKLAELNSYVSVTLSNEDLTESFLTQFKVVVLTNSCLEEQLRISEIARSLGIAFIVADTRGLYAQIFCDFGHQFQILDATGNAPISVMISSITEDGIVMCHDETRHGFEDGDYVTFSEVKGYPLLNQISHFPIKVLGPYTFAIQDNELVLTLSGLCHQGITATQVKVPFNVSFKSFKESLADPEYLIADFAKMESPSKMHVAFQTLHAFVAQYNRVPKAWSTDDAALFLSLVKESSDDEYFLQFAKICSGNLNPMAAAVGGIVAQEVMKACSGKFMPIKQWLYFDALECLPEDTSKLTEEMASDSGRYAGQIAVFGKDFQRKLEETKYFVVGAGAIGCELLKNFAMMGVGSLIVTDMDHIEKSNLNRQFLFRPWDVQKPKSIAAAAAIKLMNPNVRIEAHENRVDVDSEHIYNDDFFRSINGVANALDNVDARIYMDRRCVYYKLPLLESGTLGTKGNTQVVIPDVTESYSSSQDPPEKSIPICTLKNFPNQIEHTLQWARDVFEGTFTQVPMNGNKFLTESDFVTSTLSLSGIQPIEIFESIKKLIEDRPSNFDDCIRWAHSLWHEMFRNSIAQLLHNFPPDQINSSTGAPFWSGPKRCPRPLTFNSSDPLHLDFIVSGANLIAEVYGLPQRRNDEEYIKYVSGSLPIEEFIPKSGIKIAITDNQAKEMSNEIVSDSEQCHRLIDSIPKIKDLKINALEFEKDDDSNFHMDFIVSTSNLRALNYSIPPADRHKSKLIAGRIIPAIATTTSLVSAFAALELIKLVEGHRKIDVYKNSFVNLALPFITFSEPVKASVSKYYDVNWTLWDRFVIEAGEPEMTLQEFLAFFKEKHNLEITMLSQGVSMLYSFFMAEAKKEERLKMPMTEVVRTVSRRPIAPHIKALIFELCCNDKNDEDAEVPFVEYRFRK